MHISPLFIDKIAGTVPIRSDTRKHEISGRFFGIKDTVTCDSVQFTGPRIDRYKHTVFVTFEGTQGDPFKVLLSIFPINTAHNFLRFEFNPAAAGPDGIPRVHDLLNQVLGAKVARHVPDKCRNTRLDLTIDAYGLARHYYPYLAGFSTSKVVTDGQLIESEIIGTDRRRLTVYRKADYPHDDMDTAVADSCQKTRIEFCLRDLGCSITQLADTVVNPFSGLHFVRPRFLKDDRFSIDFRRSARKRGINAALHALPGRNEKARHIRLLQEHYASWFNPDKIWRGWPAALAVLDALKPDK